MTNLGNDHKALSRTAHEWHALIQSGDATDADRQALKAWLNEDYRHEDAYDRALTYWAAYDHLQRADIDPDLMPPPAPAPRRSMLGQIQTLMRLPQSRLTALAAIAAAMTLVIAPITVFFLSANKDGAAMQTTRATFSTGVSQTKTIPLQDGTIATLGALSTIEFSMTAHERSVQLKSGVAFFDVMPDPNRPFSVHAGDLTALALGTKFDVRRNGDVFRVAVAEGLVEVAYPIIVNGKAIDVTKRTKLSEGREITATTRQGLRPVRALAPDTVGAWRRQKLIYDGATLSELVADANRYDARRIVLSDDALIFADETLTASFDTSNIDRMLTMLTRSFPVMIDHSTPDVVLIRAQTPNEK